MGKLENKVAIVTGATAGIGLGIVDVFAQEGAKVVFCGRREEKGKAIEAEYRQKGFEVTFVKADMTSDADIDNLFAKAADAYGRIDILVNNAGVMKMKPLVEMDVAADWDSVIALNLKSYFVATPHRSQIISIPFSLCA